MFLSSMAVRINVLIPCIERLFASRRSYNLLYCQAFSTKGHLEALNSHNVEPSDKQPLRYDSHKMAMLFDNVKSAGNDDGILSVELSGITSSIAGVCWHKEALADFVRPDDDGSSHHAADGNSDSVNNQSSDDNTFYAEASANTERDVMLEQMKLLMDNERKEKERIRSMLAKQQKLSIGKTSKHVTVNRDVSTMKLLKIASGISGRQPAHAKPQLDERKARREHGYYKNLSKHNAPVLPDACRFYQNKRTSATELIRVLDVDELPLTLIHHMLCYAMVKHMPAETVIQVISRIASLRDNNSHVGYQNLLRDLGRIASPLCRAEVVALLSRCYQSISVPFMVDYVRRFGTFSRRFMAKLIQTHSRPLPLDFLRYRAGQRSMNQILTRPWALFGYVKLLKKSSSKTYMYHNLLVRGYVPNETEFDRFHTFGTLDAKMATTILNSEKLLNSTVQFNAESTRSDPARPKMYDEVLEAHALGIPLEDVHAEAQDLSVDTQDDVATAPSAMGTQLVKIQTAVQQPKSAPTASGFRDVEDDLPANRSHISWKTPWGRRRDVFHFKGNLCSFISTFHSGKTYSMDEQQGWRMAKSPVRPHYLKNIRMNRRKRQMKALRRSASKLARKTLAERMR